MSEQYKLVTIKDIYDKLDADQIVQCLKELSVGMVQTKSMDTILSAVAEGITSKPMGQAVTWPEESVWTDDGKGDVCIDFTADNTDLFQLNSKVAT